MARSRNIKPGFFANEKLGDLDPLTRLLFVGLWTIADKEGRLEDRPKRIHVSCLPYDQVNVDSCLDQLSMAGFIIRYSDKNSRFIQIVNWKRHQSPHHKEIESEIPEYQQDIHACAKHDPSMDGKNASCPSDSLLLIPSSLIPDSLPLIPDSLKVTPTSGVAKKEKPESKSLETWKQYSSAYFSRYGVEPVRNAKTNSQLCQVVDRLGSVEAPAVAAFYVTHSNAWYVQKGHAIGFLLADAEKLRTEWLSGRRITTTEARQQDRKQNNFNIAQQLIEEGRVKNG